MWTNPPTPRFAPPAPRLPLHTHSPFSVSPGVCLQPQRPGRHSAQVRGHFQVRISRLGSAGMVLANFKVFSSPVEPNLKSFSLPSFSLQQVRQRPLPDLGGEGQDPGPPQGVSDAVVTAAPPPGSIATPALHASPAPMLGASSLASCCVITCKAQSGNSREAAGCCTGCTVRARRAHEAPP